MPTKHFISQKVKQRYNKFIEKPNLQTAMLGNAAGVVQASRSNYVYARLRNGEVVEAFNDRVPSTAGRPVLLRWERGRWMVESTWQVFSEPLWNGVSNHAPTHDLYGSDPLYIRSSQFLPGLVIPVPGAMSVIVCNPLTDEYQTIDISGYIPVSGAIWAVISCGTDGALAVTTGGAADSPGELSLDTIPGVTGLALAALKLFTGQLEIVRSIIASDIVDLRWIRTGGGGSVDLPPNKVIATKANGQPSQKSPAWDDEGLINWTDNPNFTFPSASLLGMQIASDVVTPGIMVTRASDTNHAGAINFTKYGGSLTSPSAVQSGWRLGSFSFGGHFGSGIDSLKARIAAVATQVWSAVNRGAKIVFSATPNNSSTMVDVAEFAGERIDLLQPTYAPTPSPGANSTQVATTEWVRGFAQPVDADLTAIAGLTPADNDIIQRKAGVWTSQTMAQLAAGIATHLIPANMISGLQLQWVSGTAITIGTGSAMLPNGTLVNATSPIAKSGLSLAANTWYHVYLFLNGATPDIEIVTTAPAAPYLGTARAKTGDTSRRYVGSVRTNAAANLRNFYQQNDIVFFRENFDQNRVVVGGTAIVETVASCQALVPTVTQMAILRIANSATTGTLATGTSDDSVSAPGSGKGITVTGSNTVQVTPHSLNENQEFTWWYSVTPSGGVAFVDVYGYYVAR